MNDHCEEFDAFQHYLLENGEKSQPSPAESKASEEFKLPGIPQRTSEEALPTQSGNKRKSTEKLEEIFSEQDHEGIDKFFDEVKHSISIMGSETDSTSENVLELMNLLFSSQGNTTIQEHCLQSNVSIPNIDESVLSSFATETSFNTNLKNALLAGASKNAQPVQPYESTVVTQRRVFSSLGPFYGLPAKVQELIKTYKGIDKLYDWQEECLRLPAIQRHKNLIYALPTSGGKTLVAEILMLREIMCYKRNALFILPYVAIVQEKVWSLSPFAVALDFLVEEYAASKGTYPPKKRRRKHSIYVATIEKALGLLNSLIETGRLDEIGLVVIDELHLLGELGRGATLEALISKMMIMNRDIQIVGMSATIGNVNDLCKFMCADVYSQNFRPVELTEYVKCDSEIAKVNWDKKQEELFTMARKTDFGYSTSLSTIDPDRIGGLVMEVVPQGSCLVFCPSKKNCENVAYLLSRVANKSLLDHKREEKVSLKNALQEEMSTLCRTFEVSIQFGIAYHHSGLTGEERRLIEDAFRAGVISVICCTSTLAAGVNLPAKRVILRHPYIGKDFINISRYKQMVGRAGRAGLGEEGDSILICSIQELPKVRNMLLSPMDEALSNLHQVDGRGIRHFLLSCINLGLANTRVQLQEISKKTLLAIQCERLDVNMKKLTDRVICDLFKLGALEDADLAALDTSPQNADVSVRMDTSTANISLLDDLNPTSRIKQAKKRKFVIKNDTKFVISKLGRAAIKGNFDLSTAHMMYDDLYQAQKSLVLLNVLHLLYLVTPYDIADQTRPNSNDYYNIIYELGAKELQTAKILGINDAVAMKLLANQPIKSVSTRVMNRFYVTLTLYSMWNGSPVFKVSEKFGINRGIVQNLMTSSATFASNVVNFCEGLEEFWTFAILLKGISQRLSHCCMRELVPLMELPAVKQNRARQLFNAGYKTLQNVARANANDLVESIEFMTWRIAKQLIANAKMLLLEKVENLREEAEDVLEGIDQPNPHPLLNQTTFH